MHRLLIIFALLPLLLAAAPASRPAVSDRQLADLVAALDHVRPLTRESAATELLQLRRDNLPRLKQVVDRLSPLSPEQTSALREIVLHVYLSGEPYDEEPNARGGFLGLVMSNDPANFDDQNPAGVPGVQVIERMLGLPAYAALRNGDVIIAIKESPGVELGRKMLFTTLVGQHRPGTTLHFTVIRQGRQIIVPVMLAPRPLFRPVPFGEPSDADRFNAERLEKAMKYYQETFAVTLGEMVSVARQCRLARRHGLPAHVSHP